MGLKIKKRGIFSTYLTAGALWWRKERWKSFERTVLKNHPDEPSECIFARSFQEPHLKPSPGLGKGTKGATSVKLIVLCRISRSYFCSRQRKKYEHSHSYVNIF
jgi:hypothetical protein